MKCGPALEGDVKVEASGAMTASFGDLVVYFARFFFYSESPHSFHIRSLTDIIGN